MADPFGNFVGKVVKKWPNFFRRKFEKFRRRILTFFSSFFGGQKPFWFTDHLLVAWSTKQIHFFFFRNKPLWQNQFWFTDKIDFGFFLVWPKVIRHAGIPAQKTNKFPQKSPQTFWEFDKNWEVFPQRKIPQKKGRFDNFRSRKTRPKLGVLPAKKKRKTSPFQWPQTTHTATHNTTQQSFLRAPHLEIRQKQNQFWFSFDLRANSLRFPPSISFWECATLREAASPASQRRRVVAEGRGARAPREEGPAPHSKSPTDSPG